MKSIAAAVLILLLGATPAFAQSGALPDQRPKVDASLIAEDVAVAPGGAVTVALKQSIRKGWHTYWLNPGDSGAATTVNWHLPPGWSAGSLQWPYPERLPVGPLMNFGYEGEVALLADLTASKDASGPADISADVSWLVCSDVCVPENAHLSLRLDVRAAPPPPDSGAAALFAATRARLPKTSRWPARYDVGENHFALLLQNAELRDRPPRSAVFYPYGDGMVEAAAQQRLATNSDGLVIETAPGYKLAKADKRKDVTDVGGVLVLAEASGKESAYEVRAQPGPIAPAAPLDSVGADLSLWTAALFAFLGGVILNLMPCVFPVLSMKALTLARDRDDARGAKAAGLAFVAGVEIAFLTLAGALLLFRSAGSYLGWGFQLQQPGFVAALALVMFAIGLNLSGLYEIPFAMNGGGRWSHRGGAIGSFFTGVLAVVVATPCTAPFMGAAAGYALSASAATALLVFAALGAGFAAPFAVISLVPAIRSLLPRPGGWMNTFRQFLAFPMYAAAVWLIWVLSLQAGSSGVVSALAGAVLGAFGLWLFGKGGETSRWRWLRSAASAVAFAAAVLLAASAGSAATPSSAQRPLVVGSGGVEYEPFTPERLAQLQESGQPVFVNATAAWCITCLVNERLALSGVHLKEAFAAHHVAALKADWTNEDASITALLARHGRSGVPLYLYYAPHAAAPIVLPQLLTESGVISALEKGG